MQFWRLAV